GVVLSDYLTGTRYRVEMERDLSLKQQVLDILIIEQSKGAPPRELPDGLENFARYNLLTFKSLRQPLNAWALDELIGHYVNYRKQVSPSLKKLLPEKLFRLYAVSMRKPKKLGRGAVLKPITTGVYEVAWGGCVIRIIVLSEVAKSKRNALWQMFSGVAEKVRYGAEQYDWRKKELSQYINTLFNYYKVEGISMPYTVEDFIREQEEELLAKMPPEKRLKGLRPEERLKGLPPEARLKGLKRKEIMAYLKKLDAAA
ncbi:MAG: hypothetical protein AAB354_17005, partial [candidate division KSB1 bacterium]